MLVDPKACQTSRIGIRALMRRLAFIPSRVQVGLEIGEDELSTLLLSRFQSKPSKFMVSQEVLGTCNGLVSKSNPEGPKAERQVAHASDF